MEINKNSWHYKLQRMMMGEKRIPADLCNYFWSTLIFCLLTLMGSIFVFGFLIMITLGVIPAKELYFDNHFDIENTFQNNEDEKGMNSIFFILGMVSAILVYPIIILIILMILIFKNRNNSFLRVIKEYIKSLKNKYCPRLEFKD